MPDFAGQEKAMAWKKVSPEKCDLLETALEGFEREKKQMFGCPAYFVGANWFAGVHEDNILVRLNETDQAEVMAAHPTTRLFEPFPGRVMREFVVLPEAVTGDRPEFVKWLEKAHTYSRTLAPKKKPAKKKAAAGKPR